MGSRSAAAAAVNDRVPHCLPRIKLTLLDGTLRNAEVFSSAWMAGTLRKALHWEMPQPSRQARTTILFVSQYLSLCRRTFFPNPDAPL
jgi:hypothetical protein